MCLASALHRPTRSFNVPSSALHRPIFSFNVPCVACAYVLPVLHYTRRHLHLTLTLTLTLTVTVTVTFTVTSLTHSHSHSGFQVDYLNLQTLERQLYEEDDTGAWSVTTGYAPPVVSTRDP